MRSSLKKAMFVIAERILRCLPHPGWRAWGLRCMGAHVGHGVRVHPCRLMNYQEGFSTLHLGDGVFVGEDVLLDLAGQLYVGARSTLSARSCVMTHSDPGASHQSPMARRYPPTRFGATIGQGCWIGVGAIVLDGVVLPDESLVAAGAVVTVSPGESAVLAGVPAKVKGPLRAPDDAQPR